MLTKTFTYQQNGTHVTVTVQTETGRAYLNKQILYTKPGIDLSDNAEAVAWVNFARALTQSIHTEGLPFVWPTVSDDVEVLRLAREQWLDLSGELIRLWLEAITDVDTPPVDPDLAPADSVPDAKKKKTE